MARKRMIHRDIWQSYDIAKCNLWQRLLFIGLITIADDEGKSKGEESIIRGEIFPFDNRNNKKIVEDLIHLENIGLIKYYRYNSMEKYIQITNWSNYQKIDHPTKSKIPDYKESIENNSRNSSENFSPNLNLNCNYNSKPDGTGLNGKEKYNYAIGMEAERQHLANKEKSDEPICQQLKPFVNKICKGE